MENEQRKSYRKKPTIHKVNVFHMHSLFRFLYISCETCKFEHRCHDTKHKREICTVSRNAEKLLIPFTHGRVSSFLADEFYILVKHKEEKQLKDIFKFLRMKYVKKNAR